LPVAIPPVNATVSIFLSLAAGPRPAAYLR
jgi:hypothetical protein